MRATSSTAHRGVYAPCVGRLIFKNDGHRDRAEKMIQDDVDRLWSRDELCSSDDSLFIGTGVCPGRTRGVEETEDGRHSVHSEVIDVSSGDHYYLSDVR